MQIICRILQLSDISIMAVERDKSRREGILLRMSTRDSVPLISVNRFSCNKRSLQFSASQVLLVAAFRSDIGFPVEVLSSIFHSFREHKDPGPIFESLLRTGFISVLHDGGPKS